MSTTTPKNPAPRVRCAECGKITAGRAPKGVGVEDGDLLRPWHHKGPDGRTCEGCYIEAEWPIKPTIEHQVEAEHQAVEILEPEEERQEEESLTIRTQPGTLAPETAARFEDLLREGTPENSIRAREGDLRRFWEGERQVYPVDVAHLVTWITNALDTYAVATVERTIRTLSRAHHTAGIHAEANPCRTAPVREALRAAKVRAANRGDHQAHAAAVGIGEVRAMVATCGDDLPGLRDTAVLWTLYATGLRRSELAALTVEDLEERRTDAGELAYVITVRRSKTDQTGQGRTVAMAGEAAQALSTWLRAAGIETGNVVRGFYRGGKSLRTAISDKGIEGIVTTRAEAAGLDHRTPHGLRAGFATDAVERGIPAKDVMAGRWSSLPAFSRYTRGREAMDNPAAFLTATPE